jgi:hypothetical protein
MEEDNGARVSEVASLRLGIEPGMAHSRCLSPSGKFRGIRQNAGATRKVTAAQH